jgi:hypothetical protein
MSDVVIFATGDLPDAKGKGMLGGEKKLLSYTLSTETIKKNLQSFLASLDEILPTADQKRHGYGLDTCQVAVSINGKGQVGFLGTGGELGGSATLTLSFKRS